MAIRLFKQFSQEQYRDALSKLLPSGDFWISKDIPFNESNEKYNFYWLLYSLAKEYVLVARDIDMLWDELSPDCSLQLIENWEQEVGIPDEIFPVAATIEERRENIRIKKALTGIQTLEEMNTQVQGLGIGVEIKTYKGSQNGFPYKLPFKLGSRSDKRSRFVLIIDTFGTWNLTDTQFRFIESIAPSNVLVTSR